MSPIQFKFTKPPDGLVRRVTFQDKPSWNQLATKLQSLYNIPVQSIGVSYVDSDGDEVTLSSEEELRDFYLSATMQRRDGPLTLVKFTVRDLDSLRSDKPLPETPRTASGLNYRNTFGRSAPVLFEMEVDDGWQPIPSGLAGLFAGGIAPGDSPHAFVEVLESDADVSQSQDKDKDKDTFRTTTYTDSTFPEINPSPTADKGKARARTDDLHSDTDTISSDQSVIAEESGNKHPIHVYNAKKRSADNIFGVARSRSQSRTATAPRTPTPRAKTPAAATNAPAAGAQEDDPPLPDLNDMPAPETNIAHDVANLFGMLSGVLASHPELSEGIRNIVRNASNGTYWHGQQDSVIRAAEEIRRSALIGADEMRRVALDSRRSAEEIAGRRVADALSNVIRVIADITDTVAAEPQANAAPNDIATSTPIAERDPLGGQRRWGQPGFSGYRGRGGFGRAGLFPPRGPHESIGSWGTFGSRWGDWSDSPSRGPHPFSHFPPPSGPPPPHSRPERAPGPPPPLGPPPPSSGMRPPPPPPPPGVPPLPHMGIPPPPPPPPPPPHFHGPPGIFGAPGFTSAGPPPHHHFPPDPFGQPPFGRHQHVHSEPGEWSRGGFGGRPPHFGGWGGPIPPVDADWADTVPPLPPAPAGAANGDAEVTMYGASPVDSPESVKKSLQAAKDHYLAEKERYRRIREDRKKRKMNVSTDSEMRDVHDSPTTPNDVPEPPVRTAGEPSTPQRRNAGVNQAQIISNARGPFPQLQLYPVPRRSHTIHGVGHARDASFGSNAPSPATPRAVNAITTRLNDMGFTSSQYPALAARIEARVARSGEVSQDREDAIVAEIVEELVQSPPPPRAPQASGSGPRAE